MPKAPRDRMPYLLWVNYGLDNWTLASTANDAEALLEVVRSEGYSEEWLITKEIKFKAVED